MKPTEFDAYALQYRALHAANIKASGEEPEFFARYKIDDLATFVSAMGLRVRRILDFGAGIGNSVPFWQAHFPGALIVCLDVSGKSLEVSASRFADAPVSRIQFGGRTLPFADGSFDVVFSACVFHHIDAADHGHWFAELARVARAGGALAIYEHNPLNPLTVSAVKHCPFDADAVLIGAPTLAQRIGKAGWIDPRVVFRLFFPRALARLRPLERLMTRIPFGAQYAVVARKP